MDHQARKADHIRINLEEAVTFPRLTTGLERYRFVHQGLPELDLAAVDLRSPLLGKVLGVPLLISSMTGGTEQAELINRRLAAGAQARGIAMGLGSQRTGLELAATAESFRVRREAPDILLLANLGAVQLNKGYGVDHCRRAGAGRTRERSAGIEARDRGGAPQYDVDEFADRLRAGRGLASVGHCGSARSSGARGHASGFWGPGGRGLALQHSVDEFADRARAG